MTRQKGIYFHKVCPEQHFEVHSMFYHIQSPKKFALLYTCSGCEADKKHKHQNKFL